MGAIFVFSDIHGCCRELQILLRKIPLQKDSQIIFLGDYIDRGEDSKGVVDTILALSKKYQVVTLMGNHEHMFLDFLEDKFTEGAGSFIYNGGGATLASYSKGKSDYHIPAAHLDFYRQLKLYHETDEYFFVHAGLPNIHLSDLASVKDPRVFLWARDSFFSSDFLWKKTIIHGHTPIQQATVYPKRINIDSGCVYGRHLTALQLPEKITYTVAKQGVHEDVLTLKDLHPQRTSARFSGILPVQITIGDRTYSFKTANYNEFGILVYSDDLLYPCMKQSELVNGIIGQDATKQVKFSGEVVRVDQKSTGIYYAIKFTNLIEPI